jgi:hypothetical protein
MLQYYYLFSYFELFCVSTLRLVEITSRICANVIGFGEMCDVRSSEERLLRTVTHYRVRKTDYASYS